MSFLFIAPYIIRWGATASSDRVRRSFRRARCGNKGAIVIYPIHVGAICTFIGLCLSVTRFNLLGFGICILAFALNIIGFNVMSPPEAAWMTVVMFFAFGAGLHH
jgi:hypothetical protein